MARDGVYFVNDTGKSIIQLLDEAKQREAEKVKTGKRLYPASSLMTRVWDTLERDQNGKLINKRLVHLDGAGWLKDEDLAQLPPDEEVHDFDRKFPKKWKSVTNATIRLRDLQIYKSARRKAGLPPLPPSPEAVAKAEAASRKRKVEKAEAEEVEKGVDAAQNWLKH